MLATVAFGLVVLPQRTPLTTQWSRLSSYITKAAVKRGWKVLPTPIVSTPSYIEQRFQKGSFRLIVVTNVSKPGSFMETLAPGFPKGTKLQPVDEPALERAHLSLSVPDFTNIRIRDMKEYAANHGMAITGSVDAYRLVVTLQPTKPNEATQASGDKASRLYNDAVALSTGLAAQIRLLGK